MSLPNIYDLFPHRRTTVQPVNGQHEQPPPTDGNVHPYAQKIRTAWLDRLDQLNRKPWIRGDAWDHNSFVTARKLVELSNSTWTGYTLDQAQADYYHHAPRNENWDEREKCWDQAVDYSGTTTLPPPPPGQTIPDVTVLPELVVPELDPQTENDFWDARPILRHIHDFARARRTSPWATLGVTLARIITATPHQVCLPPIVGGRGSINIFIGLVGPSGAGKGAASGTATDAIHITGIKTARLASGEAIAHLYKRRLTQAQQKANESEWNDTTRARLIDVGEIDRFAAQSQRQGSTLMADLRAAWSGEMLGQVAADSTRSFMLEPHSYRLTMVAGIQPHRAAVLLDDEDGGTPQRFIWFPVADPDAPDERPDEPEPLTWTHPPLGQLVSVNGAQMGVPQTVVDEIDAARIATLREQNDPLDGHKLQSQLKAAVALALADQRLNVNEEDWELAATILHKSDATRASVVATMSARAAQQRHQRAEGDADRAIFVEERTITAAITRVGNTITRKLNREGGTATHSDILRAISSRDRGHYEDAIRHLIDNGKIAHTQADDGNSTYHLNESAK